MRMFWYECLTIIIPLRRYKVMITRKRTRASFHVRVSILDPLIAYDFCTFYLVGMITNILYITFDIQS